jgi:transposase
MSEIVRPYKPEISVCPICGSRLVYRYTVSNKVIQFSNGKRARIKNLGYSCPNQDCQASDNIFTSQTASKFCIKGYTYSAKIIAYITLLKMQGESREKICAKLALMGVDISDRNVDKIAEREMQNLNMDYKQNILVEYQAMMSHFGQIRISIDSIGFDDCRIVSVRNSFNNVQIGLHICAKDDLEGLKKLLHEYVDNPNIKCITTVRKITDFFKILEECVGREMEYIPFVKY